MAEISEISWTDATFNPWWGCTKVSPACDNCYAERDSKRYGFGETGSQFPIWGKDSQRRFFGDKHWNQPRKWNAQAEKDGKRLRVFCASMADVMEDRRDLDEWRVKLWKLIEETPNLDWLLLTKRPQNFRRFLPEAWIESPMQNVWGMTTVESPQYLWRVDSLLKTPFSIRGLSCEPIVAPLDLEYPKELFPDGPQMCCSGHDCGCMGKPCEPPTIWGLDWVIAGGESGPSARPADPNIYRLLRDQCVSWKVPFHFKQWGEFNADQVRVGKKAAGRELDGRTWDEFPVAKP